MKRPIRLEANLRRYCIATLSGCLLIAGSGIAFGDPSRSDPLPGGDLDVMLKQYDAQEQSAQAELDSIAKDLKATDARIVGRGRGYYKQLRAGLLPAGNGFDELVDHAANVERTRLALLRDLEHESALHKREKELNDQLAKIKADRVPLEVHRQAMTEARSALQQQAERRAAFGRAFEGSTTPPVAIYGPDTGPASDAMADGFAKTFGHLPLPLAGRAEYRRIDKSMSDGPALEFVALRGAVARTVAPGRVRFADKHDGAFEVILDHGDRYFTVYGNLASVEVKTGDVLTGNTALGPVGARYGEGPILHFEIRQGDEAVDPAPWLGL